MPETTRDPDLLHITRDEASWAAEALSQRALKNRTPALEHVAKCLRALSAGAIKAIWVEVD